jgi:glycerophosphoryl diester phosphodiesterase
MLRRAEAQRARLVEADVHLFAGRLEVRHLKTIGPLPVLWDRWYLAPRDTPRLELRELLAAVTPETELMLDLKGIDPRLPGRLAAELARHPGPVTVCSRNWRFLRRLRGPRIVHSVGSRRQLRALRRRFAGRRLEGVSIHRRLLDAATVADLRRRADMVLAWPVATAEEARRLAGWGVDGMISERYEALAGELA